MARKTQETSTRQQAFTMLDGMTDTARKDAVAALMSKLNIGSAYAKTIYQQHRNAQKESGALTSVYHVRDNDKGMTIVTSHVVKPSKSDARTPADAVKQYCSDLQAKIAAAGKLDTTIPEPAAKPAASGTASGSTSGSSKASSKKKADKSGATAAAESGSATAETTTESKA